MAGDEDPIAPDRTRRNATLSFAAQMVTSAGTAVLTLYLVRSLGPEGYGTFVLAVAVSGLAIVAADMGLASSAARYIAERRTQRARVREVFGDALRLKLALAGSIAVVLVLIAGPISSWYATPSLVWPVRAIAIAVVGQSVMGLAGATFNALRRVSQNLLMTAGESFVETTASIALVVIGTGATGAAFGRAIGYVCGATGGVLLVARTIGRPRLRASSISRNLIGYAAALVLIDAAITLFNQVDVFVIGAYLNTAAVGAFEAPMRLTTFLAYPGLALAAAVAPQFARSGDQTPPAALLATAIRLLLIGHAAVAAIVLVWARPIAHLLFGNGYADSPAVLRGLTPFILLAGIAPLVSLSINYLGHARKRLPIAVGTVLANLVIDLLLVPRIGVVGGAIGTDVAYVGYVLGHLWLGWRDFDLSLRRLTTSAARCLLSAAVMAGSLALWGTESVPTPLLILGGACGLALYGLMLLGTRELAGSEIVGLYRSLAGRFAGPSSRAK
jgi:O-antigen/teichoic acid export membrane protein